MILIFFFTVQDLQLSRAYETMVSLRLDNFVRLM